MDDLPTVPLNPLLHADPRVGDRAAPGLVIVGAGLAGVRAAQAARDGGYASRITIVGEEVHLPYNRPPLSKSFLAPGGDVDYFLTEADLSSGLGVELHLGEGARALDLDRRDVVLSSGRRLSYERLIIATGSAPRTLPQLPSLAGIATLRTVGDAERIRAVIRPGAHLVVIGAGFIGSEIASSARAAGAQVTIIEAAPVPLVRAVGEIVGDALAGLHERNGTRLLRATTIDGVEGHDHVESVLLSTGEQIPADLVIVGVGAAPATEWLADSGIELDPRDGGLVCDSYLQTSAEGVYAAGDVAHWPNGMVDATMRLENWTNAADQGAHAAINALFPERSAPYLVVPYFWSDWYGNRIQFAGTALADSVVFASGGPDDDRFVALFGRDEKLVGAATLNEPRTVMRLRRMIGEGSTMADALAGHSGSRRPSTRPPNTHSVT
jgi:NADPH-dependent 2,4-dienoyl-CoA reductase/sulfur reductase-like enzyme